VVKIPRAVPAMRSQPMLGPRPATGTIAPAARLAQDRGTRPALHGVTRLAHGWGTRPALHGVTRLAHGWGTRLAQDRVPQAI
jgi:hypothetical protein